jgi:hypothetical protein
MKKAVDCRQAPTVPLRPCPLRCLHQPSSTRRFFSMCLWTHENKTFFSYQRLTRSGCVGQGRAFFLRAAQRAKRLDGRWSGGYFATGVEGQP